MKNRREHRMQTSHEIQQMVKHGSEIVSKFDTIRKIVMRKYLTEKGACTKTR